MKPEFSEEVLDFLNLFFDKDNLVSLEGIYSEEAKYEKIAKLVDRLAKDPRSTVIPYTEKSNKEVTWFGLAFSDEEYTFLGDNLSAFLGQSYSTFHRGHFQELSHSKIDDVARLTKGRYYAFKAENKVVFKQIERMISLWDDKKISEKHVDSNINQFLRNFYTALEMMNEPEATVIYKKMKSSGKFSAENILFLEVQMLARFQKWKELFEISKFSELTRTRRPASVTEAILIGIYFNFIKELEEKNDFSSTIKIFQEHLIPLYQGVFQWQKGIKDKSALKVLAAYAIAVQQSGVNVERLKIELKDETFYVNLFENHLKIPKEEKNKEDLILSALSTYNIGDFYSAFNTLQDAPLGVKRTIGLIECAMMLLDLDSTKVALNAYNSLSRTEKEDLISNSRLNAQLKTLRTLGQENVSEVDRVPGNWLEWFEYLSDMNSGVASHIAQKGSKEWSIIEHAKKDPALESLYSHLISSSEVEDHKTKLKYSLSYLVSFLESDNQWPRQEWRKVYVWLIEAFLDSSDGTVSDVLLFNKWIRSLNNIAMSTSEYSSLAKVACAWIEKNSRNPEIIKDSVLKIVEVFEEHPQLLKVPIIELAYTVKTQLKESINEEEGEFLSKLYPSDWGEWLEVLSESPSSSFLIDIMPVNDQMNWSQKQIESIENFLIEAPGSQEKIKLYLPKIHSSLISSSEFPQDSLFFIYEQIIDLMDKNLDRNNENNSAFINLLDGMLRLSPKKVEIRWNETLNWFKEGIYFGSAKSFLDTMELFFDYSFVSQKMVDEWKWLTNSFWTDLERGSSSNIVTWLRVGEYISEKAGIEQLYLELEKLKNIANTISEKNNPFSLIQDKTITIFTLRDRPAKRVEEYVKEKNSSWKVNICTDKILTDRSKEFAKKSDISIIVATCITHALTYGIKPFLKNPPLYPRSAGETAIIDKLEEHLLSLSH